MRNKTLVSYLQQPMLRGQKIDDCTETVTAQSTQAGNQEVDLGELRDEPEETLPAIYSMQAAAEYAMDLAARRASREENGPMSQGRNRGAWREDYEMRVFGGPTE
jgi:hypothetical protein